MAMILTGGAPGVTGLKGDQKESYEEFNAWMARWLAQPMVWVRYRREAYVGIINSDIRITLDRNLCCSPARGLVGTETATSWLPVETRNVILELKFDDSYPDWVAGLIQRFRLNRRSYSKYGYSVRRGLLDQTGAVPLARAANS